MTASSTPELEADRQALIALIGAEAVFHGDFTLSSGKKASYYVDMRKLTLDHRAAVHSGQRRFLEVKVVADARVAIGVADQLFAQRGSMLYLGVGHHERAGRR